MSDIISSKVGSCSLLRGWEVSIVEISALAEHRVRAASEGLLAEATAHGHPGDVGWLADRVRVMKAVPHLVARGRLHAQSCALTRSCSWQTLLLELGESLSSLLGHHIWGG